MKTIIVENNDRQVAEIVESDLSNWEKKGYHRVGVSSVPAAPVAGASPPPDPKPTAKGTKKSRDK